MTVYAVEYVSSQQAKSVTLIESEDKNEAMDAVFDQLHDYGHTDICVCAGVEFKPVERVGWKKE